MNKKTVVTIAVGFIAILVVVLLILWLMSLNNHKYYTYDEVETKMVEATEEYYKKNPTALPTEDGKTMLSYSTLVNAGVIAPLNELLTDGDSCSAEVQVVKNDNTYSYFPLLTCSDKYKTLSLVDKVLKDHEVTNEGKGLYSDNTGGYYFRGKVTDNYVAFGNYVNESGDKKTTIIWRILGIDSNNSIRMIATKKYTVKTAYDTRYNEQTKTKSGYNDFEDSIMKEFLKGLETTNEFLTESRINKIEKRNLCIGSRTDYDTTRDGSTECSALTKDKYAFDLLKQYEYIRASLDPNCVNQVSESCQNQNYLAEEIRSSWTLSPNLEKNNKVYSFNGTTYSSSTTSSEKSIYLTINLSPYVLYKSGNGTAEDPYKLIFN